MPKGAPRPVRCSHCSTDFIAFRNDTRFCSDKCRSRSYYVANEARIRERDRTRRALSYVPVAPVARVCVVCQAEFLGRPNRQHCSKKCRNRTSEFSRRSGAKAVYKKRWYDKRAADAKALGDPIQPWTASRKAADQRRRARKTGSAVEKFTSEEIFERDGWICQLCHRPVDPALTHPEPMSKSLDHIVPLSCDGDHSRANVQLAHLDCNIKKSTGVRSSGEQLRLVG